MGSATQHRLHPHDTLTIHSRDTIVAVIHNEVYGVEAVASQSPGSPLVIKIRKLDDPTKAPPPKKVREYRRRRSAD